MNITSLLLLASMLSVSAATLAQKITLKQKNADLGSVFNELRLQTGYDFIIEESLLKSSHPINLQVRNATLEHALSLIFMNQNLTYSIENKIVVIKEKEVTYLDKIRKYFSKIDVRGRILDHNGNPLQGAIIKLKAGKRTLSTNSEGRFFFPDVDETAIFIISYVGYQEKEIKVSQELGDISLQLAVEDLQEVNVTVSTGYQEIPKERATGSFEFIDNKTFNQQVSTSVLGRLEAIANGLTVDRGTNSAGRIMIRGLNTINGPKDPLIVLDNFPYEGSLDNINPNDVASITILKDASAASIWGARAGNGVIVIMTKKANLNQPLAVSFNSNITIGSKPDLGYLKVMPTSDYIDVEQMLFSKGYFTNTLIATDKTAVTPVIELLAKKQGASTEEAAIIDEQINSLRSLDVRNDFDKYFYQQSVNQQYALNLSGGTEKYSWISSAGYDDNISSLDAKYNRLNLRFQNTVKPIKNLDLTAGVYFVNSRNENGKPEYGASDFSYTDSRKLFPYAQFADEHGNALPVIKQYRQGYVETAGNGKLLDWKYYPLEDYKYRKNTNSLQSLLGNISLSYQILPGLNAAFKYQYEMQKIASNSLSEEESYSRRTYVNRFTQIDAVTGVVKYIVPRGDLLTTDHSSIASNNFRGELNFRKEWKNHQIAVLAGTEVRNVENNSIQAGYYGYNPDLLTSAMVDYVNSYPTFITGTKQFITNYDSFSGRLNRYVSAFANAAYTFRQKYTFSASARRDASNLFGVNTNDRWTPLWSSGLAWNLSDEAFYKNKWIPYLKLRVTYGYSGNVDQTKAAVTTLYYGPVSKYTLLPYINNYSNYANPELKWEKSGMFNLGLDFKSINDRVSGSLEYYHKKGKDLYGTQLIDYTAGAGPTQTKNVASMSGNGFDADLSSINIRSSWFSWHTNLNVSYYKDKVTQYYVRSRRGSNFMSSVPPISGIEGHPVYSIYSYKWAGLDPQTGESRGYFNGGISKDYSALTGADALVDDLNFHGSAIPVWFGSMGNTFNISNFVLEVRATYKLGYFFRRQSIDYNTLYTQGSGHSDFTLRWQNPGDELMTDVPAMIYPTSSARESFYSNSEPLVDKADHIRLQYITLNYSLNRSALKRLPVKSLQLYTSINNLGLIWRANKHDIDPDFSYLQREAIRNPITYSIGFRTSL